MRRAQKSWEERRRRSKIRKRGEMFDNICQLYSYKNNDLAVLTTRTRGCKNLTLNHNVKMLSGMRFEK